MACIFNLRVPQNVMLSLVLQHQEEYKNSKILDINEKDMFYNKENGQWTHVWFDLM